MLKLFLLLSLCLALALAAPGYLTGHAIHHQPAIAVVHQPIWTTHSIVRPIIHGGLGYGHGYAHGW